MSLTHVIVPILVPGVLLLPRMQFQPNMDLIVSRVIISNNAVVWSPFVGHGSEVCLCSFVEHVPKAVASVLGRLGHGSQVCNRWSFVGLGPKDEEAAVLGC